MTNYDALQEGSSSVMGKIMEQGKRDDALRKIRKALKKTPAGATHIEMIARGQGPMRTLSGMGAEVTMISAISHTTYHMRMERDLALDLMDMVG